MQQLNQESSETYYKKKIGDLAVYFFKYCKNYYNAFRNNQPHSKAFRYTRPSALGIADWRHINAEKPCVQERLG